MRQCQDSMSVSLASIRTEIDELWEQALELQCDLRGVDRSNPKPEPEPWIKEKLERLNAIDTQLGVLIEEEERLRMTQ
jgi:hypothetical protein